MKIVVSVTIEVDPDEWAGNNGIERSEVRSDVKEYVLNSVKALPSLEDVAAQVTGK